MALPDFLTLSGCYLYKKKELMDAQAISTNDPRSDARKSIALGTVKTRLQLAQKKLFHQLVPVQAMI